MKHPEYLSSREIIERYLSFFRMRGHHELEGNTLVIPENTTSFVIAGMQPLLPYLRGQVAPPARRLTSLQRCLRSFDADAVGTNNRKNTAFFMLGNWSINNYEKREAIMMAYEFMRNHLHLDPQQLWISVFAGDSEMCLLPDETAYQTWLDVGISRDHIVMLGSDDNFWTMGSGPGPCGPCSEIFVDRGPAYGCGLPDCKPGCECERFLEIWNLVFMEYERTIKGTLMPLPVRCIDTGMGLERTALVLQEADSVFSVDLFQPALSYLDSLVSSEGVEPRDGLRARRMILDHTRAVLLAGLAGIEPGRDGRNSVVRRLIRRAARQGHLLGIERPFLSELIMPLVQGHQDLLLPAELQQVSALIHGINQEERGFAHVLKVGLRELARIQPDSRGVVPGERLYRLHAEKGFPADLAAEVLEQRGITIDWPGYDLAAQEHRRVSRASAETHFRAV